MIAQKTEASRQSLHNLLERVQEQVEVSRDQLSVLQKIDQLVIVELFEALPHDGGG
jgi:predicted DNA-binding protein YlxM (UPF0122 family)